VQSESKQGKYPIEWTIAFTISTTTAIIPYAAFPHLSSSLSGMLLSATTLTSLSSHLGAISLSQTQKRQQKQKQD
jgi:hypothetical protein